MHAITADPGVTQLQIKTCTLSLSRRFIWGCSPLHVLHPLFPDYELWNHWQLNFLTTNVTILTTHLWNFLKFSIEETLIETEFLEMKWPLCGRWSILKGFQVFVWHSPAITELGVRGWLRCIYTDSNRMGEIEIGKLLLDELFMKVENYRICLSNIIFGAMRRHFHILSWQ